MSRRPYYRHFLEGLPISQGQVIKFQRKQAGNTHAYLLKAAIPHIAGVTPDFALFEVLNPTVYVVQDGISALSIDPVLLPGDKLIISDLDVEIENTGNDVKRYSGFYEPIIYGGRAIGVTFTEGRNLQKEYRLHNEFREFQMEFNYESPFTKSYYINILNVPDDFQGFLKVINETPFESLRTEYPVVDEANVEVAMSFPSGITVSANYDTGSSFLNDPAENDFFYLEFSRSGGGTLYVTKYAINTEP